VHNYDVKIRKFIRLGMTTGSTYAYKAEIATALGVYGAGLEKRLALPTGFDRILIGGSGGNEGDESQSEENGRLEKLHC
jgi:hypothetical protein